MKLYQVTAKCGHVGKGYYVIKDFPVKAGDGKEAARLVRNFPRVKHHQKDAILKVVPISIDEYDSLIIKNHLDPYFHCTNVQEQRLYQETIFAEVSDDKEKTRTSNKIIYHGKELIRNPKKYFKNYYNMERYAV